MELNLAYRIAKTLLEQLSPHCEQIYIAGSVRRKKLEVKDIEFVLIPKPYEVGIFASGIAPIIDSFAFVKGVLPCKYCQRELSIGLHEPSEKIKIDFFFADEINIGWIHALRTGSSNFNFKYLEEMKKRGYVFRDGYIWNRDKKVIIETEENLFQRAGMKFVAPEKRT